MNYVTLIGFIAGFCSTIAFVPQVIKTWKTKKTRDISWGIFPILITGAILWTVYGTMTNALPIIITNLVSLSLISIVLFYKIKYK